MSDPQRWLDQGGSSLEAALLRSARADAPPAGARDRALAALGLATPDGLRGGAARTAKAPNPQSAESKAFRGAPLRSLSRRSLRLPPAARAVLFESVLGTGEPRTGLFAPGGAGLPVLAAIAVAAAFCLAVPNRPRPPGMRGIEVGLMESPAPKADKPPLQGDSADAPVEPGVRPAHAWGGGAARERSLPERNSALPASDHSEEVASAHPAPLADSTTSSGPPPAAPSVEPPANTLTVLPFGAGMTRPVLISGRDPVYTREALAARVEGTVLVKCTITTAGTLTHCGVQKSLPWMDQAVLDAMTTRHYQPVTYQGRPISVDYVFTIRLVLPK